MGSHSVEHDWSDLARSTSYIRETELPSLWASEIGKVWQFCQTTWRSFSTWNAFFLNWRSHFKDHTSRQGEDPWSPSSGHLGNVQGIAMLNKLCVVKHLSFPIGCGQYFCKIQQTIIRKVIKVHTKQNLWFLNESTHSILLNIIRTNRT